MTPNIGTTFQTRWDGFLSLPAPPYPPGSYFIECGDELNVGFMDTAMPTGNYGTVHYDDGTSWTCDGSSYDNTKVWGDGRHHFAWITDVGLSFAYVENIGLSGEAVYDIANMTAVMQINNYYALCPTITGFAADTFDLARALGQSNFTQGSGTSFTAAASCTTFTTGTCGMDWLQIAGTGITTITGAIRTLWAYADCPNLAAVNPTQQPGGSSSTYNWQSVTVQDSAMSTDAVNKFFNDLVDLDAWNKTSQYTLEFTGNTAPPDDGSQTARDYLTYTAGYTIKVNT